MPDDKNLDIEKSKDNPALPAVEQAGSALPAPANSIEKTEKPVHTAGRRIHNEITYRVIDWLINSGVGVAMGFLIARTKRGQEWVGKPLDKFFKRALSPVLKTEESRKEGAKWGAMIVSIMAGGTAIIPGMMFMENKKNKKKIVRWLDEKIYGREKVESDPKFAEAYRQIDEEPHKSFATGMAARFLALAPIVAAVTYPPINKKFIKYIYDPIGNKTKWLMLKCGIKPSKKMLDPLQGALEHIEGDPSIPKRMQSNWDFLHRTIGFDFGLTIVYAFLHEAAYKSLAAMGMKKNDLSAPAATASAEPPAPPSPPAEAAAPEPRHTHNIQPREKPAAPPAQYTQKLDAAPASSQLSV